MTAPSIPEPAGDATGRRLILLRHGRTSWNESGRAQGHLDTELDELGHQQAAETAAYLAALSPVALWSSDLSRARQTCQYLEDATGVSAKYDERLREFDVGARQGMNVAEFAEQFPATYAAWVSGEEMLRVPGSEDSADVETRLLPALREYLQSLNPGELGIVVTHGASLKVGLIGLLGWSQSLAPSLRGVDNCSWVLLEELEAGGRLRLVSYNESVHPA